MAARHPSRYLAASRPSRASYLHQPSVCFHYSYFMRQPGMKGSYFLHGGGQVTTGAWVARLTTRWGGRGRGGGREVLDSKHQNSMHTNREKNISPESVMLAHLWVSGACSGRQMWN